MSWVVLPLITTLYVVHTIATADVGIAVEIVVSVDVDIAASPTAAPTPAAAPGSADRHAHSERDRAGSNHCAGRVCRIVNWWIRINWRTVDVHRVVRRHVDYLRVRLFDHNDLLALNHLRFDFLLLIRLQRTFALGFRAHALDGIHHVFLLSEKGVTQIGSPLNVVGQALHHVGECGHGLNARVPGLFLNRLG